MPRARVLKYEFAQACGWRWTTADVGALGEGDAG